MKRLVMITFLFLLFTSAGNAATFDPSFNFSVIETKHFTIYFHQGLEEIAQRAAATAEEVHGKLTGLLQWKPDEKTHIVIADNSDYANGMTSVVPYNIIYLQTAPPSGSSSLGEYDNWLRLLIVHEYAHVLTSDPVRGYSLVMRKIFGKTVPLGDLLNLLIFVAVGPPNIMMPPWWHEGMSTWAETELTSSGRGRSSYYQMLYRTAVADNNLPGIDKINGDIPYWPAGNSRYIFGSALIQYIAETFGKERPGSISINQSGQFPYFINRVPESQFAGKGYAALYSDMLKRMTAVQQKRIDTLKKEPFTLSKKIGKPSVSETNPRYSPDGSMLAFNRNDRHSHPVVVIQTVTGTEIAEFRRLPGDGNITWAPDSASIIFSQAELFREANYYQDIYRYDLKKKKLKRLTSGMRATEPDISPDGSSLAVVINSRGNQNIGILDVKALIEETDGNMPKLITDFKESRVSSPRWSPDGRSIAFALTDLKGSSSLNLLTIEPSSIKELLKNGSSIDSPTWSPDGTNIFYSSDQSGAFNIFSYNPGSGETAQITHLLSGAFTPDISRTEQTLAIGEYSSFGPTVAIISKENFRKNAVPAPNIKIDPYPVNSLMIESAAPTAEPVAKISAQYSPIPTLLPKFWLPTLIPETATDTAIGAMTGGQDVLGYHSYLASVMYGTGFKKGYFDTIYRYGRYIPTFTLHGYALPSTYTNLITSGDFTEIERGLIASASLPVTRIESRLSITAGYHLRSQKPLTEGSLVAMNGKPLLQGRRDSLFAGVDFNGALRYPWSITSEEGRNISAYFQYYGKESGSEIDTKEYTASWEEYIPLSGHHNILARINGGLADGEQTAQQSFRIGGTTSFINPFGLRGYESYFSSGSRVVTGTLEYRFPLFYLLHGFDTKPLFLDRLHGAFFVDAGEAWDKDHSFKGSNIMTGTGIELRFDMTLGYWLKITPAIGYAHGFDKPYGTDQIYFNIYANL
jgi:Tol biopolymer transport system component